MAKILARQARRAKAQLPGHFTQAVSGLADDFGKALGVSFEGEEGEEFFRSSLIQTVFYGLFAGWTLWLRDGAKDQFRWENLAEHLKIPFLAELYYEFQHPRRIKELGLRPHLNLATETLHRVNVDAFFSRFQLPSVKPGNGQEPGQETSAAILYFYEPFLEAFDPELRKSLGVWYTPHEVIHYQVRTVDRLLREELGCERGLADDNVVVLDPCCGTGAYLIETMKCIAEQLELEGGGALMGQTLLEAATRRLIGFEILTAPFVIAQLQLFLVLSELGASPTGSHRPAIYLTNALTGWDGSEQLKLHFPELQAEYDAAQAVKRTSKIIVVMGNPPYNRFAGVPLAEEADLVDHYKGIRRDGKGRQKGSTRLYGEWGIRKQLLNDLYIRFFRLAERCIGERAEHGVVSFISNYSFYAGRSHPIMRESLLKSFSEIWIDCLNGDKYKTGKLIPIGLPGEGTTDQSIFSTAQDSRGIQVGTGITTLLKRASQKQGASPGIVHYRNYWGRARDKRESLRRSVEIAASHAEAPPPSAEQNKSSLTFERFEPSRQTRWKLIPFSAQGGFDDWPALDQLFPESIQGINPNRGMQGSLIDTDREAISDRMKQYFSNVPHEELQIAYPELFKSRADYDAVTVRESLTSSTLFSEVQIVPYVVFPLDLRWLYYETEGKLLNRSRPDLKKNLADNEFLVTVPEPRQESESRPFILTTAFDLHLQDRGSVGFPAAVLRHNEAEGTLFALPPSEPGRRANLAPCLWSALKAIWQLEGDLDSEAALFTAKGLCRTCLALCHAPAYQVDHRESLAQDWAHVPLPKSKALFEELQRAGTLLAALLDPVSNVSRFLGDILGDDMRHLGVATQVNNSGIRQDELMVEYSFFGSAHGGWRTRAPVTEEHLYPEWGPTTGDLYINESVRFRHVPEAVWGYELGGYPVIKKWLGYRDRGRRPGIPLSMQEVAHLRGMVHRIAAVLRLHSQLDALYERAYQDCFTANELGL